MGRIRLLAALTVVICAVQLRAAEPLSGESFIELKIVLPKGDTYLRGETDPVAGLSADLTLTNKTPKEILTKESVTRAKVVRLSADEVNTIEQRLREGKLTPEEQSALVAKKKTLETIEVLPVNPNSLGMAYPEPRLDFSDSVSFIITRLPEEGETVPEGAKPVLIPRDNAPDHIGKTELSQVRCLAPGETSPVYSLAVGKYYLLRDPGRYSIKAVIPFFGDGQKPSGRAESNEEIFRVLPFKSVDCKIEDLKRNWSDFERGVPAFDYLFYQVKTSSDWDELYCVQRIPVRKVDRWEWSRLGTIKAGTVPQVAPLGAKKVAILMAHAKGDAGLYTVDFSAIGPKVSLTTLELKDGALPKLKVEGGAATVE